MNKICIASFKILSLIKHSSLFNFSFDHYLTTSQSESLYTGNLSDQYLTTNATCLFPWKTI